MFSPLKTFVFASACLAIAAGPALAQHGHGAMDKGADSDDRSAHMVEGVGKVVAVNAAKRRIGLDHGPVPELKWPAMRMAFNVSPSVDLSKFAKGDTVQFTLHRAGEGAYPIVELCPSTSAKIVPGLCVASGATGVAMDHSGH